MKKKLLIIGAGEHAKVVVENALEQNTFEILGMVNFQRNERKNKYFGVKVISEYKNLKNFYKKFNKSKGKIFFCIGIGTLRGNMRIREKIFKEVKKIMHPINIINPKAHVSKFAKIGEGNLIEAFAKVSAGSKLGDNCVIESFSSIHHDQVIGDNVFLATNVALAGRKIGDNTLICDGAVIGFKKTIGKNCIILDGVRVTQNVKSNLVCYEKDSKLKFISIKNYVDLLAK
tara:strand:+ start:11853 stop:12542 length:690 start_codon:yes stop_codon:yes gene_type:complete